MGSKRADTTERGWFDKQTMAAIFGVSAAYLDRDIRPLVPQKFTRQDGKRAMFYARAVIDAWHDAKVQRSGKDGDPLLSGSDSPASFRFRAGSQMLHNT